MYSKLDDSREESGQEHGGSKGGGSKGGGRNSLRGRVGMNIETAAIRGSPGVKSGRHISGLYKSEN